MPAKCLSKRSAARRSKRSSPVSVARRTVRSLAATKKRVLERYSKAKHGPLTVFCRSKGIPYKTAYSYLHSGKHAQRDAVRKQIVAAVARLKVQRRKKRQHRNISAAAIREQMGASKCPIGERQINRILAELFPETRPRRIRQGPPNIELTQSELDQLNRSSEDW